MKQMKVNWARVVAAGVLAGFGLSAEAAPVSGQGTWETTLQGRDLDGNLSTFEAYYDTDLDITWLADANYAKTTGYDSDGLMDWTTAKTWAQNLNPYGSGTGWRLPTTVDVGNNGPTYTNFYQGVDYGYNITTHSEMSHLFYVTLGDKAIYNTTGGGQVGSGLTNTGPFSNVQKAHDYWSATGLAPSTGNAWVFNFGAGFQGIFNKTNGSYAWAVHEGDVAAVPVPAAVWLMGSGLVGLLGWGRRKAGTLVLG